MAEISSTGGGLNANQPRILPTGKRSGEPVARTDSAAATGQARGTVGAGVPPGTSRVGVPPEGVTEAPAPLPVAGETVARDISSRDIMSVLVAMNFPIDPETLGLAKELLKYGLELSSPLLSSYLGTLNGASDTPHRQAALLLLTREPKFQTPLAGSLLAGILADGNLSENLAQLLTTLAQVKTTLVQPAMANALSQAMNVEIIPQLLQLIANFEGNLLDRKTYGGVGKGKNPLHRRELMKDVRVIASMFRGVAHSLEGAQSNPAVAYLLSQLGAASQQMGEVMENVVGQSIASEKSVRQDVTPDKIYYQFCPNPGAQPPHRVEIVIDPEGRERSKISLEHGLRLHLGFETDRLGKLSLDLKVKEKNVACSVNTMNAEIKALVEANKAVLGEGLLKQGMQLIQFSSRVAPALTNVKQQIVLPPRTDPLRRIRLVA